MRILFVAPNIVVPGTNGGSTHVTEVVRALRRSHEVQVIGRIGSHGPGISPIGLGAPDLGRFLLPVLHFPLAGAVAARFRPDAIYERFSAHGLGVLLGRALGVPVVSMVLDPTVSRLTLSGADRLITTAPQLVPAQYRHKVVEVSWGANTDIFHPGQDGSCVRRRLGIGADEIVVGYTGAFYHWHGLETLVAAAALLEADPRANKLRFLLVGDGRMRPDTKARIQDAGLGRRFLLPGRVPYDEVPSYLAASDICVAAYDPVRHEQLRRHGMFFDPLKVFEYLAAGKATVTLDSPNMRRLFREGEHVFFAPPGKPEPLAAALRALALDAALRARLGAAGRALVVSRHSWQAHGEVLGTIFDSLVRDR